MSKMRGVQVSKAGGAFEVVEREVLEPRQGQIRIKVEACGVCHSDAFVKSGAFPGLVLPRVPGHEIAGRVDAIGTGVTAFRTGDRVGVGGHGGHCFQARERSMGCGWSKSFMARPTLRPRLPRETVQKALDQFGIEKFLFNRWQGLN
jgi:D-arabinose 1-dehydrogenase-like Zn-dependent alcohol dehydrogenase